MRVVTIVSLAASAALGLGALFIAKIALPNAASARNPIVRAEVQGEPVVVASRAIKYGEKLEPGMLTVIKVPKSVLPDGAYASLDVIMSADKGGPPVALFPIAEREPLLPAKLSGPGSRPTVSAAITEGMRAYTLKVDDAAGVGGHAMPGDHVDVVLIRDLTPDGPQRNYISYVVVQNARVLGMNLNADPTSDKPAAPSTATIEVSVENAQKLSVAATLGELSLALRRNGAAEIAKAPPIRTGDFLGGGGAARAAGPARPYSAILIVEGEPAKRSRPKISPAPDTKAPSLQGPAADAGPSAKS
ncbi:Flp pilus assembly protein CpaB [Phenylobacterium sp. SCN 70-31]|uniref:Flp pilus assembly protein CpaB n=1 Tax=Phenylobacterium sp. SCN 70-31 TaxID=1660129 RepID=UPI00086E5943|nr:Flp pilus assembly protein CpaB [Phenylobacterium sp. SCN 70-31]ODT88585.1 MAG: Flp pilus assembly protein CpaB [Phenylobacterium sp. SCN 70-31]